MELHLWLLKIQMFIAPELFKDKMVLRLILKIHRHQLPILNLEGMEINFLD